MNGFSYKLSEKAIEISLFGWVVRRIPYENIEDICVCIKGRMGELWTLKLWDVVTLTVKKGPFRHISIAPPDPLNFINNVRDKINNNK